ncbi:Polysaccharide pyruvyl transferase [Stieleria neptunia]|uniref:Polysaccharide pyruvyl transferase n=2 Tax=Stieleria neptunia TaxID=2527979 RepID=A0A518HJK6_9BACT|nr:Polysaccharide pyruvyl transferase [Stieleria neptunia]
MASAERNAMNRRDLLALLAAATCNVTLAGAQPTAPKHILLRSSWQTVNIGDIAHTPGVLRILETHLPEVQVTLWPSKVDNGVEELLLSRFPKLRIAKGADQLMAAFAECDFLLHGSGASLVAQRDVVRWAEETGKPYGIYGITLPPKKSSSTQATSAAAMTETIRVLSGVAFVFFRDSHSLSLAKDKGCTAPIMQFGPDGAFACDLRDDRRAEAFLAKHGLETGKFLCCIPRLRYTPYWLIKDRPFDPVKHARNEEMKEHDHAQLRAAIIEIAKTTDLKVLLCPEDQTQMQVGKDVILDHLPADVRERVVWRPNYWLTGEAVSVYVRSAGLFGNEMHSPIMCIGHGVPAIVCRWAEQTSKGYMWDDIGLGEWLFNLDDPADVPNIVPAILEMARNPASARQKAQAAQQRVQRHQAETMAILRDELV